MGVEEMRQAGTRLLAEARAVRAAYPDAAAMRAVLITQLPVGTGWSPLRAALQYLWDETVLVRDGKSGGVGVLDDEIAHAQSELTRV
jgi:hypothetical protein